MDLGPLEHCQIQTNVLSADHEAKPSLGLMDTNQACWQGVLHLTNAEKLRIGFYGMGEDNRLHLDSVPAAPAEIANFFRLHSSARPVSLENKHCELVGLYRIQPQRHEETLQ